MPSFHNEPNQLLGLPWPHPNVPHDSSRTVITLLGQIGFIRDLEAHFVNPTPTLLKTI
jgi:hypothetical protein